MDYVANKLENILRKDLDRDASVRPAEPKLSAYLSSFYDFYEVDLLGRPLMIASPSEQSLTPKKLAKGAAALAKALSADVALYLPALSSAQRRALLEEKQAFITQSGDYYLPQLALHFTEAYDAILEERKPFNPSQQLVFLYCLYADKDVVEQSAIAEALGISAGSVSSALSLFVDYGLLDYAIGGVTGRKKSYRVQDKRKLYEKGLSVFGSPIRKTIVAPVSLVSENWLKSGLSALADRSDLLPPESPVFAISPAQARDLNSADDGSLERCVVQVLKYDSIVFAKDGCVDPLTMLLTIDDQDERISLAIKQALKGCKWYQA